MDISAAKCYWLYYGGGINQSQREQQRAVHGRASDTTTQCRYQTLLNIYLNFLDRWSILGDTCSECIDSCLAHSLVDFITAMRLVLCNSLFLNFLLLLLVYFFCVIVICLYVCFLFFSVTICGVCVPIPSTIVVVSSLVTFIDARTCNSFFGFSYICFLLCYSVKMIFMFYWRWSLNCSSCLWSLAVGKEGEGCQEMKMHWVCQVFPRFQTLCYMKTYQEVPQENIEKDLENTQEIHLKELSDTWFWINHLCQNDDRR